MAEKKTRERLLDTSCLTPALQFPTVDEQLGSAVEATGYVSGS